MAQMCPSGADPSSAGAWSHRPVKMLGHGGGVRARERGLAVDQEAGHAFDPRLARPPFRGPHLRRAPGPGQQAGNPLRAHARCHADLGEHGSEAGVQAVREAGAIQALHHRVLHTFAFSWHELLFALILSGPSSQTLPLLIGSGEGLRSLDFPAVSAHALVATLPPVSLAVLTQRWIVRGLTLGAVKG